jgi:plastocyanin
LFTLGINKLLMIVLGIGITLSVASVLSIYITLVSAQTQPSSTDTTTAITIPQGASTQQVDQYYMPVNASVPKDATITWTNKDVAPHTATASDGSFDTGAINPGSTASAMVKGQGDIQYHCNIHPWMHGSLQVSGYDLNM